MARVALAPRRPRAAPASDARAQRLWWSEGVHPGWPGWPRPPRDPGLHHTVLRERKSPRGIAERPPAAPRQLRPPGSTVCQRHRRLGEDELRWPHGVHPGWPGRHWPPGDPGLHQAKEVRPEALRDPRVHPGRPGWPRPPGDPGSHQTHHGEHAAPSSAARSPGGPGSERRTGPTPHPLGGKPNRSGDRPKGFVNRRAGVANRIHGRSKDRFPPNCGRTSAPREKVGSVSGRWGANQTPNATGTTYHAHALPEHWGSDHDWPWGYGAPSWVPPMGLNLGTRA